MSVASIFIRCFFSSVVLLVGAMMYMMIDDADERGTPGTRGQRFIVDSLYFLMFGSFIGIIWTW